MSDNILSGGFDLAAKIGTKGRYGQFEVSVPALGFVAPDDAAGDGIEIFDGVIAGPDTISILRVNEPSPG